MVFVLEIAFFAGVLCTEMAVLRHPGRTFLNARTHGKQRMLIFPFARDHNSLRLLFDLLQTRELPSFVRFRLAHCGNNYFKESVRKLVFLIQKQRVRKYRTKHFPLAEIFTLKQIFTFHSAQQMCLFCLMSVSTLSLSQV